MKENVFDVLMYLFENYYMDEDSPVTPDRESVQQELSQAGFPTLEIDRAFLWMESLASEPNPPDSQSDRSLRLFSNVEMQRLDTACRGFILFLEQMDVLTPASRELAIDRAMALESEIINTDQMKWVAMMVLYNQPGRETNYLWLENLLFDLEQDVLH